MPELFKQSQRAIFRSGLAVLVVLSAVIAFFVRPSADFVILRYNVFFGVDILGVWWQVYLVPGMCLMFFLGNLFLAEILARRQAYIGALILAYGAALVVLSGAIATATLIFINS